MTGSKDIEARRSMTYPLQPNGKRGRKRSIYMSLMINSLAVGLGELILGSKSSQQDHNCTEVFSKSYIVHAVSAMKVSNNQSFSALERHFRQSRRHVCLNVQLL